MFDRLKTVLSHPLTQDMPLDSPATTVRRVEVIRQKWLLRKIYASWYRLLMDNIPPGDGHIVEIGSGAGFLKEFCSTALTSETFFLPNIDLVFNALSMPFRPGALKSLVMVDVLHHIPDIGIFFSEATRCVKPGGRCVMIEPWNTGWSRWVFTHLHHEPFDVDGEWTIPASGPLSGANGALPWILFERDKCIFSRRFPEWRITEIVPMMPVVYLLSGGISLRSLFPAWGYSLIRRVESGFGFEKKSAMFASIILDRQ